MHVGSMRESQYITENNGDICDTASQGSRDEYIERDPNFVEDRFRVDRKKLEQMLQAPDGFDDDEGAEDFFQRIMEETNTQITWPSKLKIGAKSKKDPHIKVIGYPEDVKVAKDKIVAILDTKGNRVTLKMDVSHTEHSHVIGKGGNNIKRVMQDTGCHIHFPDSNRGSNVQEKSNQVSIAGQPNGVETARAQIRELLPLVFMFELPMTIPETTTPAIQQIQNTYNVTISIKQRPRMYVTTVIVRGSVNNTKAVKEATCRLGEQLTGNGALPVSMQLEIAPQHHLFIIGRGGVNIKQIMQRTGANIHFPDPNTSTPQRKGTVYITGNMESVAMARQQLIGCLPLVLMFDVKEDIELKQSQISQLMEKLDVYISVKPKPKQPSKSVIVKSIERNATNMYLARLFLLGTEMEDWNISACNRGNNTIGLTSASGLGLNTLGYISHNMLNVNTTNSLLMLNGHRSPTSPHNIPSPTSPNHWLTTTHNVYSPLMVVTPATSCTVQQPLNIMSQCHSVMSSCQNNRSQLNGYQNDYNPASAFISVLPQTGNTSQGHSSNNSDSTSPRHSPPGSPSPITHSSPCHPVDLSGLQTAGAIGDILNRESTLTSSGHTLDLLGLTTIVPPLTNSQSIFLDNMHLNNVDKKSEPSCMDSGSSEKLAPGIERKNSASSLFSSTIAFSPFDYEEKKLMALKAIRKKPEGESRHPTDAWSGMGFSKSMPESAIRERMGQIGISSKYCEPSMTASYQPTTSEISECLNIDRDPWKDQMVSVNAPINKAPGEYPSPRKKYEFGLSSSNHVDSAILPSKNWSHKTDLAELFSTMGLGKYTDLFTQQEIDISTFTTLTDQDLRELGISTFGARRKMLLAIADMNKRKTLRNVNIPSNSSSTAYTSESDTNQRSRPDFASLSGRW
ncbi:hypothetical protein SNE40_019590 [Patella caerulea]|uniref:SAM domain-containing protein n=1 Tax=Patella caerulea TaxID=87958 RepID=A0AAN8J6R6_PATCE